MKTMELRLVLEALRKTSKGQLEYDRFPSKRSVFIEPYRLPLLRHEDEEAQEADVFHGLWKEAEISNQTQSEQDETVEPPAEPEKGPAEKALPTSPARVVHISPQYGSSCRAIVQFEKEILQETQRRQIARVQEFEAHTQALQQQCRQQEQELERSQQQRLMQQHASHLEMLRQSEIEAKRKQELLRESHRQHTKAMEAKMKEAEKKREELEREQRQWEEKLQKATAVHTSICTLAEKLQSSFNGCQHKSSLGEGAVKAVRLAEQIMSQAAALLSGAAESTDLDRLLNQLVEHRSQMENALDFLSKKIDEAEKQAKAAEVKPAPAQQPPSTPVQATSSDPSALTTPPAPTPSAPSRTPELDVTQQVLRCYAKSSLCLENMEQSLAPFTSDPQNKKYIFELRKFVNTTINAISGVSAAHLKEKLQRLSHLMSGRTVTTSSNQPLSASQSPQAPLFCMNLIARMLVKKGEEEVTSNHESAFPLAAVAVGLWAENSEMGELLLSHLYKLCPYLVPCSLPRQEGQSSLDYHKTIGYKVVDGELEPQDKFLRRMTGLMRLYAAMMVSPLPQGPSAPHPWGVDRAWAWLARVMNQEPQPDITATLIYDLLQVAGHAFLASYRTQFAKLLFTLHRDYLPRIRQVGASGGPVTRLQSFLESSLKNSCQIQAPTGLLHPNFLV